MTKTGYSCINKRNRVKPGCRCEFLYYCSRSGKQIDPMSCHNGCKFFDSLASIYRRNVKLGAELL